MRTELIDSMIESALTGEGISRDQARELGTLNREELDRLFEGTNRVRDKFMGRTVKICSIVNAKSGKCPEDCGFCAQSSKFETDSPEYPLLKPQEILAAAKEAEAFGSNEFSIVTSGTAITDRQELDTLIEAIKLIKAETRIEVCCSLGLMSTEHLKELKAAGLDRFHHNVETAASHFENIVSTHSYRDEVQAIHNAKEAGLQVCVGGIFGMGETYDQRVEMVFDVKSLETDSYPINFLKPLKGTATEDMEFMDFYEALRTIALHRLTMPKMDLFVCGGREEVFAGHQEKLFAAGANGILGGNYLTTKGQDPSRDIKMIEDLGLVPILESA
ncbi:MAG: biotin synthase BioB [Nitrospinaceae bacterium]|nr:biotin synthase BioB [Nitrospinaceae bacterium]NIR56313.1 biotin synthase BioB [Nitrospinaceae bacterium]NIS86770.1 biotin synthase BioB [Nitrospinaceae bacterium]NIT83605.1 biotin synthase BioB [Nitrospinaceae bacterium]NIU45807.1 biotin synthase BioB [Nitrospinaceae bacterium]